MDVTGALFCVGVFLGALFAVFAILLDKDGEENKANYLAGASDEFLDELEEHLPE